MLQKLWSYMAALVLSMVAISVWADTAPTPQAPVTKSVWDGSNAQFGFIKNTGNTDATTLTGGLNIKYVKNRWTDNAQALVGYGTSKGVTNKNQYTVSNQLNYAFNGELKNYMFFNASLNVNKFSPYSSQIILTPGYGRDIIKNDTLVWSAQLGAGLRRDQIAVDRTTTSSFVVSPLTTVTWNITRAGTLSESAGAALGHPYNQYTSTTSFMNKITKHFALQLSFQVQYVTSIPPGSNNTKKTDTTSNVSLVYNF